MSKLIGHLDADCFYCSCERVRYLDLRAMPIGVLGNQGACVIAKSYEMKAAGVTTGMPIWDAVKVCPHGIYIKRDFRWYEVLSRMILDAVKAVSPRVEYYSIDEMFFDAGELPRLFGGTPLEAAQALQQRILREIGIPVTIGISLSRSLAKLISDDAKPFGCKVMLDGIPEFLSALPVETITGIAKRSALKLAARGVLTCLDFIQADRDAIRKILTVKGEKLWFELQGIPADPIQERRPAHKCISRGGSLGGTTDDPRILGAWLVRNLERLVEELDFHQVYCDRLALLLAFKAGGGWGRKANLPQSTARFETLAEAGKHMLEVFPGGMVSHMHLLAEKLTPRAPRQRVLFDDEHDPRIAQVKSLINGKIGRFALRSGETLELPELYGDTAHDFDICDIHGKTCF